MPANLTPQYKKAAERFRKAHDPVERLAALEEMLQTLPKHKGTEKLQADLRRRISETRKEVQQGRRKGKKGGPSYHVESGGFPQVVVVGPPSAGKSRLIATLCGVELEVADYPFTTRVPRPAMMPVLDVKVQLVDTPPITADFMEPWMTSIIRCGDEVVLTANLASPDLLEETEGVLAMLARKKIHLEPVPEAEDTVGLAVLPTLVAATHAEKEGAGAALEILMELYGGRFEILPVALETGQGLETLRGRIYEILDRVRVYPKRPGQAPDRDDPVLLARGATVLDLAEHIHKELARSFRSARVWGSREYAEGQYVPRDHVIEDASVIEIEG